MNGAYVHLALNHIPVVAVPVGVLLLLAGLVRKSRELTQAAMVLWVLVALISIAVLKSGGPAAHVIKDLPALSARRSMITRKRAKMPFGEWPHWEDSV